MTFTRGLFIHPDATRGTTALESRQSLAGLIPGAGVLDGLTVSGTASWQYSVSAGHVATSRGIDTDGVVLFANDAPVLVDCSPAPGTGSRIDIIYAKHNDATTPNADPDSEAFAGVAEGVASGTPVAPEIPDGAVELARATVSAGATNTDHANVTISHGDRLVTTTLGGIMVAHSSAQRAAAYFNTTARPVFCWRTDTQTLDVAWGDGWKQIYPAVPPVPTAGRRVGLSTTVIGNEEVQKIWLATNFENFSGGMLAADGGLQVPLTGWYQINAGVRYASNSTGYRQLRIVKNAGSTIHLEQTNAGGFTPVSLSNQFYLNAGDILTLAGWQNSGGNLGFSDSLGYPYLSAILLGQGA